MKLYTRFERVFKHDWKWCEFLPILSDFPKIVRYQENARKTHVMRENFNLMVYFVRKHAAICRRILRHEVLLKAFTVRLFLQCFYVWMLHLPYCKESCAANASSSSSHHKTQRQIVAHFMTKYKDVSTLCHAAECNTLQLCRAAKVARHMPPMRSGPHEKRIFCRPSSGYQNCETRSANLVWFFSQTG